MRLSLSVPARRCFALAAAIVMVGAMAGPATAASHSAVFPAGTACQGFDLAIDVGPSVGAQVQREFHDRNGDVVRMLSAGTGNALTFFNDTAGKSVAFRSNGAVTITRVGAGGLDTVTSMGHNVIILFPTDVPAGPSTTLYVGRVVYTADAQSNFTLLSTAGTKTDICALLG